MTHETANRQPPTKSGFTLVELSIVLVIIGLLIGGILVGQSLIESAEINRFVSDLKQYEVATIQFHQKFKNYPGGSRYLTPPGNGDNALGSGANGGNACAAAPNASLSNFEPFQFWAHLSQSKMLSETYVPYSPQGTCAGGVHVAEIEELSTGKLIAPYIYYEAIAVQEFGYAGTIILASKDDSSQNLNFNFWPKAWMVNALENKLAGATLTSFNQIGLANWEGLGNCVNNGYSTVPCSDSAAMVGHLSYFIAPQ